MRDREQVDRRIAEARRQVGHHPLVQLPARPVAARRARCVRVVLGRACAPATFAHVRDPPQVELRFDDAA
jgi:hypothetical protein